MPNTKAMLFALTARHPSISVQDFDQWYDTRHAPSRAACPGVHSVSRFEAVNDVSAQKEEALKASDGAMSAHVSKEGEWQWVAIYELDSEDALKTDEYKKAREADGDDETKMFDFLSRRVYSLISDQRCKDYEQKVTTGMRYIAMNSFQPEDTSEQDFHDWYEQEHIPMLSKVPGWLRSSRWQLTDARDPRRWEEVQTSNVAKYLALHEVEDADAVYASEQLQAAVSTPWRNEVIAGCDKVKEEGRLLKLWKQF